MRTSLGRIWFYITLGCVPLVACRGDAATDAYISAAAESSPYPYCAPLACTIGPDVCDIAYVWSGTRVQFAAMAAGFKVFTGYYDDERWLTIAELDLSRHRNCKLRLPSRFGGWDSHNSVAMARAPDGSLHVAANMHASSLVYARTDVSGSLDSFKLSSMTGQDEEAVTYPTFIDGPQDALYFLYRSGGSGAGAWFINRLEDGRWNRVGEVFSGRTERGPVSAYPSPIVRGPDGFYHVAIVWRRTPDVRSNYAISYAKTRDFLTWGGSDGRELHGPLSADEADLVEEPGEGSGLLNTARVVLASRGNPVVLYTRYGADGVNRLFAAKADRGTWIMRELVAAAARTDLSGGGTFDQVPRFGAGGAGDEIEIDFSFPGEPSGRLQLDLATLSVRQGAKTPAQPLSTPATDLEEIKGLMSARPASVPVIDASQPGTVRGRLIWIAQAPNRDRPRECSSAAPLACNPPPSMLRFLSQRKEGAE